MPGSIKIDDGSGNYTILTNGGSLGSDKTLTIPNETATLATTTATNLGGLVKLATATASDSPTLTFDNFVDSSTYSSYIVNFENIIPASDGTHMYFNFRQGGGSGSDLTGTYYRAGFFAEGTSTSSQFVHNTSASNYAVVAFQLGTGTAEGLSAKATFFPATGSGASSVLDYEVGYNNSNPAFVSSRYHALIQSATATTGLKFYQSSGNIASGTITIFGVKK